MKKIFIIILLAIFTIFPQCMATPEESLTINQYEIKITTQNERIYIVENINIEGHSNNIYNEIFIWINGDAEDIKITFYGDVIDAIPLGNNKYSINISSFNLSQNSTINFDITYFFDKTINEFRQISFYNIEAFFIEFDDEIIFNGFDLSANSNILITLYKPSEAPINSYLFVAIFLIILVILMSTYYILRKQKYSKIKNISSESKELLSTKKLLLMSILKQLEKEYRSKKISDDTYNKLRDYYKQEAVDSMKKLEDMDSEII